MQNDILSIIAAGVAWSFVIIGFIGVFLPALPGCLLMAAGIVVYKLFGMSDLMPWSFVGGCVAAALIAMCTDYLAFMWGAKRFGAGKWGLIGAIIGMVLGFILLTPFIGLIVGPLIGAIVGELFGGQPFKNATRAGIGTVVGALLAFVIRFSVAIGILAGFILQLIKAPIILP
jgi:uncharacterized protein